MEKKIEHNCNIIHDRKNNINLPPHSHFVLMIAHKFQASISMSFNNVCPFTIVSNGISISFPRQRHMKNHFSSVTLTAFPKLSLVSMFTIRMHMFDNEKPARRIVRTMSCLCNHHSFAARSSIHPESHFFFIQFFFYD